MDKLDQKIKNIVSKNLTEPIDFEQKIRRSLDDESKEKFKGLNFMRALGTACAGIVLSTGIVFASYTAYEKIWKKPREYNVDVEKLAIISEEEKENAISEEDIKQKAINSLEIFGYPNEEIKIADLNRNYTDDSNTYYNLFTTTDYNSGKNITFNGETGEFCYFLDNDFEFSENNLTKISKDIALQSAKEIFDKINIPLDNYIVENVNEVGYKWNISYVKSYNEILDRNNKIQICLGKINDITKVKSIFILTNREAENNDFVITAEEAKNIAISKEKELSNIEISNVTVKKSIEKMNTFIYCLENNIEIFSSVKGDDRVRNVWVVEIDHVGGMDNVFKVAEGFDGIKEYADKQYYIDATTGEIIGGKNVTTDNYSK